MLVDVLLLHTYTHRKPSRLLSARVLLHRSLGTAVSPAHKSSRLSCTRARRARGLIPECRFACTPAGRRPVPRDGRIGCLPVRCCRSVVPWPPVRCCGMCASASTRQFLSFECSLVRPTSPAHSLSTFLALFTCGRLDGRSSFITSPPSLHS